MQAVHLVKACSVWVQDLEPSILLWFCMEPCAGSHTRLFETGLGQGLSVVPGLAKGAVVPPGCKFYHNNFFTTLSLVDEMTRRGLQGLWHNAGKPTLGRCVPEDIKSDVECLLEDEKLIVRWNNNSVVTVVSNMRRNTQTLTLKDGTKQKCATDVVKQPTCIKNYNSHMGGVDPQPMCEPRQDQHPVQEVVVAMLGT